jgi:CO/xanthine dehydrogenase Mo-binding subunit
MIKEFTYRFAGGVSVPMQPSGSVAKWDGDRLTMWGMGQAIYPVRATLAAALGMDAFGWEKRNPVAGGAPGRFKRGFGLGMSQHHGGNMGYHEGEEAFAKLAAAPGANIFSTELEPRGFTVPK